MDKENNNEKKGLFERLIKVTKPKKSSCCSFEIEEILLLLAHNIQQ